MEMVSGAKRARIAEEEEEHHEDHISRLPDAVLGEIVSLLDTKDGGRTQAIASRWSHIWSSAPLNLDLHGHPRIPPAQISRILSSHRGPGRRFSIPTNYFKSNEDPAATLDAWLRSPALDGLEELDFHYPAWHLHKMLQVWRLWPPPPLESLRRFSSTLRVASLGTFAFPYQNGGLHLPLLEQLSLFSVQISETSLDALLAAGCPRLQSLTLSDGIIGRKTRIRIVSKTLRSIGVRDSWEGIGGQLIIEDAPSLERFLLFGYQFRTEMVISIISAPKLKIIGQLPALKSLRNSVFEGSGVVNSTTVVPSVKVIAVTQMVLSLDNVIALMKCFPYLENLYIKISTAYTHQLDKSIYSRLKSMVTNAWRRKYRNLIGTLDIHLKKIVLSTYLGDRAHVSFAKFFVLNARVLESMVLNLDVSKYRNKAWIEKQKRLLQIEERASRGAQFDFVHNSGGRIPACNQMWYELAHDLSTANPFGGFDYWSIG